MATHFTSLPRYEKRRLLIWGKTYPELSTKYLETVCTGGVFEDGSPVRIYPIPFRHLPKHYKFKKYQWITASVAKNLSDSRPETYRIEPNSIVIGSTIPSNPRNEWAARADFVFKDKLWQFESMDALHAANVSRGLSLGVVTPREILNVLEVDRPSEDARTFRERFKLLKDRTEQNQELFDETIPPSMLDLEYVPSRMKVVWRCSDPGCGEKQGHQPHEMQVLDWEMVELQRNQGATIACSTLAERLNLKEYATRFFLGNMLRYPKSFTIVGIWYPRRVDGLLPL